MMSPSSPPSERNVFAFTLALLSHALLFCLLYFGVRWQNPPATTVQAQLWSNLPAPSAAAPEPQPAPAPVPVPVKKPVPAVPPTPAPTPQPKKEKVDIALEEEKKKKADEKRLAEEKKAKLQKIEQEKRAQQEKLDKALQSKQEENRLKERLRQETMSRIASTSAASAASSSAAAGGARGDPNWEGRVRQCIKPHMVFNAGSAEGNLVATFAVQIMPGGDQLGAPQLMKSSGNTSFDAAVERAIQRCNPFPLPSGGFQREVQIDYRLKD